MFMSGIEFGIFWDIFCSVFYSYPYSIGSMVSAISSMQSSSPSTCSSTMIWTGQSSVKVSLYSRKEVFLERKKEKKSKLEYILDNVLYKIMRVASFMASLQNTGVQSYLK